MNGSDLLDLAKALGLKKVRLGTRNLVASCPFAPYRHIKADGSFGTDKRPSFGITIEPEGQSVYNCMGCQSSGDLNFLLLELGSLRSVDYKDLEDWVWDKDGVAAWDSARGRCQAILFDEAPRRTRLRPKLDPDIDVYPESELEVFSPVPPPYAETRGLSPEACAKWGIMDDPQLKRMVLPVRRRDGGLVGVKGRTYADDVDKYLSYLAPPEGSYFYGESLLPGQLAGVEVVLVEGELDAIKVWAAGWPCLALMGSILTKKHAQKLDLWGCDLLLLPDNDETGARWAARAARQFAPKVRVRIGSCRPKKDPDSLDLDALAQALARAKLYLAA